MKKGTYVDGYVLVIPKKNVAAYKKMAAEGAKIWKKFGALDYKECIGQDLKSAKGSPMLSFTKMAKAESTDTVWFSYVVYKDKKHRDAVNKKVMAYFGKKYTNAEDMKMPFDERKAAVGGFSVVVG